MPGVGVKTASQILLAAGDFSEFKTVGHLAAYAGIAPVTRRSANQCLARRRLNVLFAMVKTGAFYEAKTPAAA
ncbi:Transposase IS116/IS110/IS902 family protein [Brevibacterium aurantiacum]|uniref:Transposase IS116/IS110/IS902 family protein n=1 Tax=Brevibacterium aurantiacum TaxID=273384 RepID=A0A2H1K935_BREAU|nr:Transposase IS116/IS110/IS902 family protein [Brevibacterium aurantiacum]